MNRSIQIALGIFIILSAYMLTGLVSCGREGDDPENGNAAAGQPVMTVVARDVQTRDFFRLVRITSRTVPSRSVDIKAETDGAVSEINAPRGTLLATGDLIAQIELRDRMERLEQARAALAQARFEFDAATRLEEQDLRSASQVAQARSALRGAEQFVRSMELDIEHTRITAPFEGMLQERYVEVGDFLGVGDPVARIIDVDPIVVEGEVTEDQVGRVHIGQHGTAVLPDGRVVDGHVRYVASEATSGARTFMVELEVPNPDRTIHAGVTASIEIETEEIKAIEVTKEFLAVTDDGRVGIKVVDGDSRVRFIPADPRELGSDSFWITGLPDTIRLITRGQGYTREGDLVNVSLQNAGQ